jgi:dolichol-phosphate mannosyltransferase
MELSVVIPAFNEKENLLSLIPELEATVSDITNDFEIIVVDGGSKDGTFSSVFGSKTKVVNQEIPGYGGALKEGFKQAKGDYILTMDADYSHKPLYIKKMWELKNNAELIIASRYVEGGSAEMPFFRKFLSIVLNKLYTWVLHIPYKDISSGYRMYKKKILNGVTLNSNGFAMLEELLVKVHCDGWRVLEVPFEYAPRQAGSSTVNVKRLIKFACSYSVTLVEMWKLRNSLDSADYDYRAYYSRILPQRLWQRKRYNVVMDMLDNKDRVLDIGCGSSKIIKDIPQMVGLDINHRTLRYLSKDGYKVVEGDITSLPFKDGSFETVICSQVIEHIPQEKFDLKEIKRVLQKDGILILGTPDYDRKLWHIVEWIYGKVIPNGYAEQHITHYTYDGLKKMLEDDGWQVIDFKYVYGMELVIKAKKTDK